MPQKYDDWFRQTKEKLPLVFAIGGKEKAFVEEALLFVRKKVLSGGLNDFNHDKLNGKVDSFDQILSCANTLPVMASHRLIEVSEMQAILSEHWQKLSIYLKDPCKSTILVFLFETLDARQKNLAKLEKIIPVFQFEHPKDHQMTAIVIGRARRHGLRIGPEVASVLAVVVGTDILLLERAFEKLRIAIDNDSVEVSDIAKYIANSHLGNAFLFGGAVAIGERKRAVKRLAMLRRANEAPLRLVGLLAWQMRNVLKARLLLDQGLGEIEVSRRLSMFGEQRKNTIHAANRFHVEVHALRLLKVSQLDCELKCSSINPWLCLERVVLQLCPK